MNNQRRKRLLSYGLNSLVLTTTITAILGLGYFLVDREVGLRLDWTSSGANTLSEKTKDLLGRLKEEDRDVTVYFFQLPVRGQASRNNFLVNQKVADLLTEYEVRGHGHFAFETKDVYRDPLLVQRFKVTPGATVFLDAHNEEMRYIIKPDELVSPPQFPRDEPKFRGEEAFTTALQRILDGSQREVCFVSGHEELPLAGTAPGGMAAFKTRLESENYVTKTIDLLPRIQPGENPAPPGTETGVPETCRAVVIAGPKQPLAEPEVEALLNQVRRGRGLIVLLDPFDAQQSGIDALTARLGVQVIPGLLRDQRGLVTQWQPIPEYLSHEITSRLRAQNARMALRFASALKPVAVEDNPNLTPRVLLQSSPDSAVTNDVRNPRDPADGEANRGPFALAVAVGFRLEGKDSPFGGRAVIVGDSDIARNDWMPAGPANGDFLLNIVHWAVGEETRITITPKSPDLRSLNLTVSEGYWVLAGTAGFLPLLIGVLGGIIWFRRRSRL